MATVLRQLVLVFGSFVLHFLSTGISQSFGVIYSELTSVFEIGEGETGLVASLFTGLLLGTGKCFDLHKIWPRTSFTFSNKRENILTLHIQHIQTRKSKISLRICAV